MPESHQGIHSGGSPSWAEAVPAGAPAQEGSSPAGLWERRVEPACTPSRVRPQPLVVPPGCAHTLPVSSSPAPASEGPGISAPSPTIRSGGLHGQTCQGPGALHFYYSGCYLLSAFYFPGVQFKYCYVILFYLCKP